MQDPYLMLITFLLAYFAFFISYQLALAFIGVSLPVKRILLPILLFSAIACVSKLILNASAPVHTIVLVIACAALLFFLNKIDITLSLIGSLLSFTTLTLGSMLLACPIFTHLGYVIPSKFSGTNWMVLNLLELVVPALVLIILKATKFSLMKYIPITK